MAASDPTTAFTSASSSVISRHADRRDVEADVELCDATLYGRRGPPLRLLVQQHYTTWYSWSGKLRVCAWMHIRRHQRRDVVAALRRAVDAQRMAGVKGRGGGRFGPLQEMEVAHAYQENPIYHVVVRGNDPELLPKGQRGKDIIASYIVDSYAGLRSMILERLDSVFRAGDFSETPVEMFRSLVADRDFTALLEDFYHLGEHAREHNIRLAGRLEGDRCFLHRAIKVDEVELVEELLLYVPELTQHKPWMRLAEPFLPVGRYNISAFHRAVYDARPHCLQALMRYAEHYRLQHRSEPGHNLLHLRNLEDRRYREQHGVAGMTSLEMADIQQNNACYNILAPFFGVPLHEETEDWSRDTLTERLEPGVAVWLLAGLEQMASAQLPLPGGASWAELQELLPPFLRRELPRLASLLAEPLCFGGLVGLLVHRATLYGAPPTRAQASGLVASVLEAVDAVNASHASMPGCRPLEVSSFGFLACKVRNVRETVLSWLQACTDPTFDRVAQAAGQVHYSFGFQASTVVDERGFGLLPRPLPDNVELMAEQFAHSFYRDVMVGGLARDLDILPASRLLWSVQNHVVVPSTVKWFWAVLSKIFAPEKYLLRWYSQSLWNPCDELSDRVTWEQQFRDSTELVQSAVVWVYGLFWHMSRLIRGRPECIADNLEPEAVMYVAYLLRAWLRGFDVAADAEEESPWFHVWRQRLAAFVGCEPEALDGHAMHQASEHLVEAMDKAICGFLRMDNMLNHQLRRLRAVSNLQQGMPLPPRENANFREVVRAAIPPSALPMLPRTTKRLDRIGLTHPA